ncbi:PDDEXK family nuclease [Pseudanabaena yagii]|uniref:DUF91 domain-containing protein n=1 Tax=Pseudanabaena yagii GIHE-NHR1 TaxID=2722753 RepID=A0ABX1LUY3_9CYAN|nr:hypothetical protein [Pseudanabaena yagii]NMF59301.1 hypothetical protein [Pseudanabaena yagii GIHE-NHR1]
MPPRKKSITPKYFGQGGVSDKIPRIAYTANALRFQSEEDLEIYIENHFDELFPDLELLQRQFRLKTNRYDLLCRHKHTHQAVILELKNEEDRSIIWQLVRYRKLIITERPFSDQINYSLPIELIAIAPSFHEDSLVDQEACKFEENIKLLKFNFLVETKTFQIEKRNHVIPYSIAGLSNELVCDSVPKWSVMRETVPNLAALTYNISDKNREGFWNLRKLFLAQPKVKEIVNSLGTRAFYATSDRKGSKNLAEICISDKQISFFLYLPSKHTSMSFNYTTGNPVKLKRFEIIFSELEDLFKLESVVQYVALSSTRGISSKERENLSANFEKNSLIHGRDCMPKWCTGKGYFAQLSFAYNNQSVFEELYPELVSKNPQGWWEEFQKQETDKLGWFVDLAIRAWRYRI